MSGNPAEIRVRAVLQNPDRQTLAELRREAWTSHNIPLSEDESTLGPGPALIGEDARTRTIKSLIRRFLPHRPLRVLDLGALEGGLSFEMAREGWDVVGVEGRESNFRKAELIGRYFGLENLRFEMRDVKTLRAASDGRFDAVLCCGLLYHLDDPFGFLRTLRELTADDGLLFLDTHVSPATPAGEQTWGGHLSPPAVIGHGMHEYEGRWFSEPSGGSVLEEQWSAVSNARSFWPAERSLIRAVSHSGFQAVMVLYGMFEIDGEFPLRDQYSRVWLACLPRL